MKLLKISQFWVLLTLATYLSLTSAPPQAMQHFSDKLLHIGGYLGLFLSCTLINSSNRRIVSNILLLLSYSVLIEVLQHFIPNRGFSVLDILANATGLLCGACLLKVCFKEAIDS